MAMSVTCTSNKHWLLYCASITQEQSTTSTSEVTLGTITIPGNSMGVVGWVRIIALWRSTGGNYSGTMRTKFGGNICKQQVHTSGNNQYDPVTCYVWNQNATNAQGSGQKVSNVHLGNATVGSFAVDTTADVDITFTGLVANAGKTLYLRFASVEVHQEVRPA